MRVIPVLDLMGGRAVHARGGRRETYAPVRSRLVRENGNALALARAFHDALGCDEWYVADLDAITGSAPQHELLGSLAQLGGRLLVDAGCTTPERAHEVVAMGATRVVVGLERLRSFGALAAIGSAVGRERLVFSLDLVQGQPIVRPGASITGTPLTFVDQAARAGIGAIILLDLARVGTGRGIDLELAREVALRYPNLELLAGGGIGTVRDIERVAEAGGDGVLVATALHEGRLLAADLEAVCGRGAVAPRRARHASDSR